MITNPDQYFIEGCGRCPQFATSSCKVVNTGMKLQFSTGVKLQTSGKFFRSQRLLFSFYLSYGMSLL